MLAKRHGGKRPHEYVSDVLRFGTRIIAHGSSDMPIWGPIFASMDGYDEVAVRKRIRDLSEFLASLQQKESSGKSALLDAQRGRPDNRARLRRHSRPRLKKLGVLSSQNFWESRIRTMDTPPIGLKISDASDCVLF